MTRVLLVGASGRLGTAIRAVWDNTALPFTPVYQYRRGGAHDLVWDPIEGSENLERDIDQYGPIAAMIVMAGVIPPSADLGLNVDIAEACLEAAQRVGIERILLSSSSAVYGGSRKLPYAETDTPKPTSQYGAAKLEAEQVAKAYNSSTCRVTCLRIGNVIGADALIANTKVGQSLKIDRFEDGLAPKRTYIGPTALSKVLAHLAVSQTNIPFLLNVGGTSSFYMNDVAEAANRIVSWKDAPANSDNQYITLDCSVLQNLTPFSLTYTAASLIQEWSLTERIIH